MSAPNLSTLPGTAFHRITAKLEANGSQKSKDGKTWQCPGHPDKRPSLGVKQDGDRARIKCYAGCDDERVLAALGLTVADLYDTPKRKGDRAREIIKTYDYTDEFGGLLFQTVRYQPKDFRQRMPDGNGGWKWSLKGARRVLYQLPEVISALEAGDPIYIVEGEKDVEAIRKRGLTATCSPMGAGKWCEEYAKVFAPFPDADVRIVADKDAPGYSHTADEEDSLCAVGLVPRCFEAAEGKDVSAHLASGLSLEDLVEISAGDKAREHSASEEKKVSELDPGRFFAGNDLIVPRLGRVVQESGHVKAGIDGRLYFYDGGVYLSSGEAFVRDQARELLGDKFKRRHIEEVLSWISSFPTAIGDQPPTDVLNVPNGLLDWKTGNLKPHSPSLLSTTQFPVKWKPEAKCPRIEKFLGEVVNKDSIEFIEEIIGYTLYAGNPMRKAVMLLGLGCNGKSVLLNLIQALAGDPNVSNISLQVLAENRFAVARLIGKVANICGDLDARAVQRSEIFKKVTGGDSVAAEWKFKPFFEFKPYALLLFSANELPHTSDQTPAWFDRWLIVPMDAEIKNIDPELTARLTTTAELEGLLVLAVNGLRRLMERGHFDIPEEVTEAGEDYRDRVDSVKAFVGEFCEFKADISTNRTVLYDGYSNWMKSGNRRPVSRESFYEYIRRNYRKELPEKIVRGTRYFNGIRYLGENAGEPQAKDETKDAVPF